jgi:hypothetical protein
MSFQNRWVASEWSTDYFNILWHTESMSKKDGSSRIKTIQQVREATQADVKRVNNTPPTAATERKHLKENRSVLG